MAQMVSRLHLIADEAEEIVAECLKETAEFILTLIRIYAPVKTGALRASYQIEVVSPLHILIGSAILYAIFQEYGTSRQSGTPHVTPAFAQAEAFILALLRSKLQARYA